MLFLFVLAASLLTKQIVAIALLVAIGLITVGFGVWLFLLFKRKRQHENAALPDLLEEEEQALEEDVLDEVEEEFSTLFVLEDDPNGD